MSGAVPAVAIVGGGFSGAAIAFQLTRMLPAGTARIVVFEPRAMLGAGLAYDTGEPAHRINVPASRMSLAPDDPGHFVRWLSADARSHADTEAHLPDGRVFPRRSAFGRYVDAHVRPLVDAGAIEHARYRVRSVRRDGGRWAVQGDGDRVDADLVVIATSHPPPSAPAALTGVAGDPGLVPDPLVPGALDAIAPGDSVLILGTGLTMADAVASLDRRGHAGPIMAMSRRGQRSRGHGAWPMQSFGDFAGEPATTTRELLRRVRAAVVLGEAAGMTWHAVFDRLRAQGGPIWQALPTAERRRLVRHLRPFWDTHRFRIAPQVEAVLERRIAEGTLAIVAGSLSGVERTEGRLSALFRRRGRPAERRQFDRIVVTTGPGHGALLRSEPYLAELAEAGFLQGDDAQLGIACDAHAHAIGIGGRANPTLMVGGPLARGTFGELMGLPEVSDYARTVAAEIAAEVRRRSGVTATGLDAAARSAV